MATKIIMYKGKDLAESNIKFLSMKSTHEMLTEVFFAVEGYKFHFNKKGILKKSDFILKERTISLSKNGCDNHFVANVAVKLKQISPTRFEIEEYE